MQCLCQSAFFWTFVVVVEKKNSRRVLIVQVVQRAIFEEYLINSRRSLRTERSQSKSLNSSVVALLPKKSFDCYISSDGESSLSPLGLSNKERTPHRTKYQLNDKQ